MTLISECPIGFEDGSIVGYRAESSTLEVHFRFWNDQLGTFAFGGFVGLRDLGSIGVTVGSIIEKETSELVNSLVCRLFERVPEGLSWVTFQFCDLDDQPMLEVVAESCSVGSG
jgi:hypothetical protein